MFQPPSLFAPRFLVFSDTLDLDPHSEMGFKTAIERKTIRYFFTVDRGDRICNVLGCLSVQAE